MDQQKQLAQDIQKLRKLYEQLKFFSPEDILPATASTAGSPSSNNYLISNIKIKPRKILSSLNPKPLLQDIWDIYQRVKEYRHQLSKQDQYILDTIKEHRSDFFAQIGIVVEKSVEKGIEKGIEKGVEKALVQNQAILNNQQKQQPDPCTIYEVIKGMLSSGNNCEAEQKRKKNILQKLLYEVGLNIMDDYSKFHSFKTIQQMAKNIQNRTDIKGDNKRKHLRYIKELVHYAHDIEPDFYKLNVIANLPKIAKTKKAEKKPHLPYSNEQLLNMFDPKHDFFKKEPDCFWLCMIALFTGSRQNAAFTLQYDDIVEQEGFKCIHFTGNDPIKHLKNDASERFVPIHNQLLDLGFLDYIKRKQKKYRCKGKDFIFPKCKSKKGNYNSKYITRTLTKFLIDSGIKGSIKDGYDFHSFRKNASLIMQYANISETFINDIIGWEGKTTMTQHYSNHTLTEIKAQMDTFEYDFLKPHFAKWKTIMAKKP